MTDAGSPRADTSPAWTWWEARRPRYGLILIVVGLVGFGLQATAILVRQLQPLSLQDLFRPYTLQALVYLIYMVLAHVAYLLGVLVEGLIKPEPVEGFRRYAWMMGTIAAASLPLLVSLLFALVIMTSEI